MAELILLNSVELVRPPAGLVIGQRSGRTNSTGNTNHNGTDPAGLE